MFNVSTNASWLINKLREVMLKDAILYFPSVCSPSISLIIKHCKLSLLANITQSSNPMLQGIALKLDFGSGMLQIKNNHHEILTQARNQLSTIPSAKKLCTLPARKLLLQRRRFYVLISLGLLCVKL